MLSLKREKLKKAAVADGDSFEFKCAILRDIAYGYDLDVICLTETWLNRRVARIFCGGGRGGAYLKNRDQIMNVLNDTQC